MACRELVEIVVLCERIHDASIVFADSAGTLVCTISICIPLNWLETMKAEAQILGNYFFSAGRRKRPARPP
jgi:hypothetical protein